MVVSAHRRLRAIPQYRSFRPPDTVFTQPITSTIRPKALTDLVAIVGGW